MEEKNLENQNPNPSLTPEPQQPPVQPVAPQQNMESQPAPQSESAPVAGASQIEFDASSESQSNEGVETVAAAPTQQVKYAGFWIRYVAYFIDAIVISIFSVPLNIVLGITLGFSEGSSQVASLIGSLASWVIIWIYYIFMTNNYQATLGKMALGIKVVSGDFQKLSLGKIVIRETIGKLVSLFIIFIGYIMAGFTGRKQALHDFMAGSVVVYKDPNKKFNVGIIIAIVVGFVIFTVAIIGILASIVLVSLNSARDKARDAAVISGLSATVPSVIICDDEGAKISSPNDGGLVCNIPEKYAWPNLLESGATWGGCDEDIDLSDGNIQYCAKTATDRLIKCTVTGCKWEDGQGDMRDEMISDGLIDSSAGSGNAVIDQTSVKKSEYESAMTDVEEYLNAETGAGSNMEAGAAALDQGDLVSAKQQFVWTKEKIGLAKTKLSEVTPLENEKDDYDGTVVFVNKYDEGLDKMIMGIDTSNEALISEGVEIIVQSSLDLMESALEGAKE